MDIYSFSRLNNFNTCQYQYYVNYILKKRSEDNFYTLNGRLFHELVEKLQLGKITNKEALDEFENIRIKSSLIDDGINEKIEKNYFESIHNFLKYYKPVKAKKIKIEKEVFTYIGEPRMGTYKFRGKIYKYFAPIIMRGYIDLVVFNDDGTVDICDYKTSSIYGTKDREKNSHQLIFYALAMMKKGYKVNRVYWNFMKYCRCSFNGRRSKRVQRNKIVAEFQNQFHEAMIDMGIDALTAQFTIEKAMEANDLELLPEEVRDLLVFEDEIIEYPLNDETIQATVDFIESTVKEIESKNGLEIEYSCKKITLKDNYFCSMLCGVRDNCPAYKKFIEKSKDSFKEKVESQEDLFLSILG